MMDFSCVERICHSVDKEVEIPHHGPFHCVFSDVLKDIHTADLKMTRGRGLCVHFQCGSS